MELLRSFSLLATRFSLINDFTLDQSGLDYDYVQREGRYRIRMTLDQFKPNVSLLESLLKSSFEGKEG